MLRHRRFSQPQHGPLKNEIGASLVVVPPWTINQVSGLSPTTNGGGGISKGVSSSGNSLVLAGNSSGGLGFSGVGGLEYTFIFRGSIETAASGYGRFYADEAVSGNHLAYYDGVYITVENGTLIPHTSSTKQVTLLISCSSSTCSIWIDGEKKISQFRAGLIYQNVCFFNRATDWARQFKGAVSLAAWIPRSLNDSQCAEISKNPWQIFAPQSIPFAVSAGGGATDYSLTGSGITTSTPTLGSPSLTQNHAAAASTIATSAPTLGSPVLAQNHAITGSAITASSTLGSPAIAQNHALTGAAITTGAATLGSPALSGDTYNLFGTSISATPTLSSPALTQNHALSGGAVAAGIPTFGTPTLAQQHEMLAAGITTGEALLSSPTLTEGGEPPFTQEQLDYLLAYMQEHLMIPTAAQIATAVWGTPDGHFVSRFGRNKFVTDPTTGIATLYDDDDVTVLAQGQIFEDAAGTQPYRGKGAERRERLA